jgi:phosphoglucomutase
MEITEAAPHDTIEKSTIQRILIASPEPCAPLVTKIANMEIETEYFPLPGNENGAGNFNYRTLQTAIQYCEDKGHEFLIAADFNTNKMNVAVRKETNGEMVILTIHQLAAILSTILLKTHDRLSCIKSFFVSDLVESIFSKAGKNCKSTLNSDPTVGWQDRGATDEVLFISENHEFVLQNNQQGMRYLIGRLVFEANVLRSHNRTLFDMVMDVYKSHGFRREKLFVVDVISESQRKHFSNLVNLLKRNPPAIFGGVTLNEVIDYESGVKRNRISGSQTTLKSEAANIMEIRLSGGLSLLLALRNDKLYYCVSIRSSFISKADYFKAAKTFDDRIVKFIGNINRSYH